MSNDNLDLTEIGRAHLANRGYQPTENGVTPAPNGGAAWVVQRRRGEDPSLHEYLQDDGVPGQRPWGSLYRVKSFWSWREAQNAIRLQDEGGLAVRLKSLETAERPLVPSSKLTLSDLGL